MNYVLTAHAIKRREYLPPHDKYYLLKWMHYFDTLFRFDTLEAGGDFTYKIYNGGRIAIVALKDNSAILVTFKGFKPDHLNSKIELKIKEQPLKYDVVKYQGARQWSKIGTVLYNRKRKLYTLRLREKRKFLDAGTKDGEFTFSDFEKVRDFMRLKKRKVYLVEHNDEMQAYRKYA